MKRLFSIIKNGIVDENPIFRLVLGMCPTLAVTTSINNGLAMGLATTFVLVGSNLVVSMIRKIVPDKIRIPAFIVVIATFVTIVKLMMEAFFPTLNQSLGLFIPLIVVNCIILARAEAFASKNTVLHSLADAVGMGVGFTLALALLSAVRELLGNGSLMGIDLLGAGYQPALIFIMAPGGFITLGVLLALMNSLLRKRS